MKIDRSFLTILILGGSLALPPSYLAAQETPEGASEATSEEEDVETLKTLTPFVVTALDDEGYRATSTLAGTRLKTPIFDTPAAVTVLTRDMLDDIGAEDTEDFLAFATSADHDVETDELGGLAQVFDVRVKVRQFMNSLVTRDYFPWAGNGASDGFNVDRVELNRGPNNILYGIGGPGGVINTGSKQAHIGGTRKSVSFTVGSWNKKRATADISIPLVKDKLAVRFNGVWEESEGWRDFEFRDTRGFAVASSIRPFKKTLIRAQVERVERDQQIPYTFPTEDFSAAGWLAAGAQLSGDPLRPGDTPDPDNIRVVNLNQVLYAPQLRDHTFRLSTLGGADMRPDLEGIQPTGYFAGKPGPGGGAAGGRATDPLTGDLIPLTADFRGPGSTSDHEFTMYNVYISQSFGNLHLEAAYQYQDYDQAIFTSLPGRGALIPDPNVVLPGAYFGDGANTIAGGRDPGTLLPDIGAPNPQAGGLYVEGPSQFRSPDHFDREGFRLTAGYDLDLSEISKWLGRHSFAGLYEENDKFQFAILKRHYNATPGNDRNIDDISNWVYYRTYLDFDSPGGMRGAFDPFKNPIPSGNGVTPQYFNFRLPRATSEILETWMVAGQSRFFKDRLIVTYGYRDDTRRNNRADGSVGVKIEPSRFLYANESKVFLPETETSVSGDTTTLGVVVKPVDWLGFTYNQANSFNPSRFFDLLGVPFGTEDGDGKDYGVRLNLLKNRLYLGVNRYETDSKGQFVAAWFRARTEGIRNAFEPIIDVLIDMGQPLPAIMTEAGITELRFDSRERTNIAGEGWEVELVGKFTDNWSISLNYSKNETTFTNPAPDYNGFLAATEGDWRGNMTPLVLSDGTNRTTVLVERYVTARDNTPNRDFDAEPATINDAYEFAETVAEPMNITDGNTPTHNFSDSINFITTYRFPNDAPSILKAARIGFGGKYRAAPVIGYGANSSSILGESTFYANLMIGKRIRFEKSGRSIDFQLNVDNVFGEDNNNLLPYSAAPDGTILRWKYPRDHSRWKLTATYRF